MAGNTQVLGLLEEMLGSRKTPEEVCRDCPELLPEVQQRWQQFCRIDAQVRTLLPGLGTGPNAGATAPPASGELSQVPGESPVTRAGSRSPPPPSGATMPVPSAADLVEALRLFKLLEPAQAAELARLQVACPEPRALAAALLGRGWLTPYQANLLLEGRGVELLLGSYVLLERLGEGGMGAVFKARNWKLGRVVAVKLIRKESLDNPDAVRRFHREIRAAAQLDHPNIVRALDADEVGGTHLLVMEYAPGADLARLVEMHGPLPVETACDYCRQAALGLQHAHERGLVHRDVKPSNLLLTPGGVVKVLDMGLARINSGETGDGSSTMTRDGTVVGTVDYMAPEQAMNSHAVDGRTDLYSLGCSLYFLLAGRGPFPGGTAMEKLVKHRFEEPEAIELLRPGVPPAVAAVVRTLMGKRPEDRYPSAAAASEALAAAGRGSMPEVWPAPTAPAREAVAADGSFLDGPSCVADTVVQQAPGSRRARRLSPWLVTCTALGVALLVLGVIGMFLFLTRGPAPETGKPEDSAAGFDRWAKEVAALPPERQGDAVAAELKRRNPGFNAKVKWAVGNDAVTDGDFSTDQVTDISPLRALPGLTNLTCKGTGLRRGRLSDLSPLNGLRLTSLDCSANARVSDLSPLKGAGLIRLDCSLTRVADLSPLKGMKLTFLACAETRVADLSPLRGMPLAFLSCARSPVASLSPLVGMPLDYLDCAGTKVSDLSPLRGMKLTTLYCDYARIRDLSALKGMPLKRLHCDFDPKRDAKVLRSIPTLQTVNDRPAAEVLRDAR
jgi:tRNA A-37 threonylcarbamoyl transferase component Bud32